MYKTTRLKQFAKIVIMTLSLIATFLFYLSSCTKSDDELIHTSPKPIKALIVNGNSAIRLDPIPYSSRIALLKKGEAVEVLDKSKEKTWLGNNSDYWYKVRRKNGIAGWTFATNIRIITDDSDSISDYITEFMKDESKQISKALVGKWWSVNSFGDFTNHCIELNENNTYKSYTKGSSRFIEGEYSFDFNKSQIFFLKGATFGNSLVFTKRGQSYSLSIELPDQIIQFKKVASEINNVQNEVKENKDENKAK